MVPLTSISRVSVEARVTRKQLSGFGTSGGARVMFMLYANPECSGAGVAVDLFAEWKVRYDMTYVSR